MELNPVRRGEKPATKSLLYDMAKTELLNAVEDNATI
jgi:hypothetical protein